MVVRKVALEKAVMTVWDKEPVHISCVTGIVLLQHLQEIQGVPFLTGTISLNGVHYVNITLLSDRNREVICIV